MTPAPDAPCPCCSGASFAECCHPFLSRKTKPATAEQLMRSRFSAYVTENVDYLVATHHPKTRDAKLARDIRQTMDTVRWLDLTVLETRQGAASDKKGIVQFQANYQQGPELGSHLERSRFERHQGDWRYLDGTIS